MGEVAADDGLRGTGEKHACTIVDIVRVSDLMTILFFPQIFINFLHE